MAYKPKTTLSKHGKKIGRPRKSEISEKKAGGRGKVGRPRGDAAIMNEYKARMLARPDSNDVLNAIYQAALDENHKNQAAAWKIITDRMLPVKMFEEGVTKGQSNSGIKIEISTVGNVHVDETVDAEFTEVEDEQD